MQTADEIAKIAAPYIATAKGGDVLRIDTCANPPGWWSVLRNERPIHHMPDKDDAEALAYAIAAADGLPPGYSLEEDQDGDWLLYGPPDVVLFSEPGEPLLIGTCDRETALADAIRILNDHEG